MTNMEESNSDGACTNRCQKFEPNVFNKSKCQTCFKSKDEHSAKALENTKNSRKILFYCYLFVAPSSFNFDNPLDRTRRWQRRLFVLYDDGELTYSLDENVDTVPQGAVNINTCLEIKDAEQLTSHKFSIVIHAKDGSRTYVKGSSNEEIERFRNKLKAIMDISKPTKVRRNFTISHTPVSNKEKSIEATPSQNKKHDQPDKWALLTSSSSSSSVRNSYLSRPSSSLTEDGSGIRSSRVLSEISNRTISHSVNNNTNNNNNNGVIFRTDSDFSSDVVDSGADRKDNKNDDDSSKPTSNGTTFRNLRRLKNKNNEKLTLGINNNNTTNNNNNIVNNNTNNSNSNGKNNLKLRKCISLQALDDGATSDNECEVRSSNTSVGDIKNRSRPRSSARERHRDASPRNGAVLGDSGAPSPIRYPPLDSSNVTVRSSRSRKKYRKSSYRKRGQENVEKFRSMSVCGEREQLRIGGMVLGGIRFWEERSRSCEALKIQGEEWSPGEYKTPQRLSPRYLTSPIVVSKSSVITTTPDSYDCNFSSDGIENISDVYALNSSAEAGRRLSSSTPSKRSSSSRYSSAVKNTDAGSSETLKIKTQKVEKTKSQKSGYENCPEFSLDEMVEANADFDLTDGFLETRFDGRETRDAGGGQRKSSLVDPVAGSGSVEEDRCNIEFFEKSLLQSRNFPSAINRGTAEQVNGSLDESFNGSNHGGSFPRATSPLLSPSSLSSSRRQSSMTVIPSPSLQSTGIRSQRSSGCTWPYFNNLSSPANSVSSNFPEDKNIATKLNFDDLLRTKVDSNSSDTNAQSAVSSLQHRLEDVQNELLNSQNVNSLILSEISKFVQLPQINNRTQKYQISEVQEILTKLNLSVRGLESGRAELEQRTLELERKEKIGDPVDGLKATNESLNALLADRESLIRKLKKEVEKSSELAVAGDTSNKILEKNLLQTGLALKESEMKIGLLEKELSELKGEASDRERIIAGLRAQLLGEGQGQRKHSTSCCDDMKFERDSLLLKVDGLNKLVSNLESDLSEEKLGRESARKSFLKKVSEFENKAGEDKLKIENLHQDVEHLKTEHSEMSVALSEKNTEMSRLASNLSKVQQRLQETAMTNEKLKSLSEDYRNQIESLSSSADAELDRTSRLDTEINKLISENEELVVMLEFSSAEKSCLVGEVEKLGGEVSNLQKEKIELLEKLSLSKKPSFSEEEKAELEIELRRLREHSVRVVEELKVDHQKKVLRLECEVGELTERLKASEKERKLFNEKKSVLENELNQISLKSKQADKDSSQKDKKIQALEKLISELKPPSEKSSGDKSTGQSASSVVGRTADVLQADQIKTSDLEKNNSSLKQQIRKLEVDLEEVRSSSSLKLQELLKKLDLEQRRSSRFCDSLRKLSGGGDEGSGGGGVELSKHLASLVAELEEVRGRLQEKEELVSQLEKKLELSAQEEKMKQLGMESLENPSAKVDNVEVINNINRYETGDKSKSSVAGSNSPACEKCLTMEKERNDLCERIKRLQQQIKNLQDDHQYELAVQRAAHKREMMSSKEETMRKLADAEANCLPINEDSIRKTYSKDVNKIKEIYYKGFHTLEKSQQQTIAELKRNHVIELERLRLEKEQLLQEEAAATQSALDAMRKAHEAELERERRKFLEKLSQTYSIVDIKALQKKHEEDVKFIEVELRQLSEQYSVKCLENAALNERLKQQTNSLHENRKRVQDLLSRNEELTSHMKYEIEKLNRVINGGTTSSSWDPIDTGDGGEESSALVNLKEASSHLRQAEVFQLNEQLKNALIQLENANEELKEYREKYQGLQEKMHTIRRSNASGSFDGSVVDSEISKQDDDADSTLIQSNNSDWSLNEATALPVGQELFVRNTSAKKLTWKYKGKSNLHGRDHLNARLTLEKCKSVDSDHSVASVGFSESEIFFDSLVADPSTGATDDRYVLDDRPEVKGYENRGDNASEDDYADAVTDPFLASRIGDGCSAQGSGGEADLRHHGDMNNNKGDKGDDDDDENSDSRPQNSSYLPYLSGIDFIAHPTGV